jgi:hypothetical protein
MRKKLQTLAILAVAALVVGLLAPGALLAQSSSGDLSGKVVDSNKAPLPGVTVTATNKDIGLSRSDTTGADGTFRLGSLPVGTYNVSADLTGYGTVTVEGVQINVSTNRNLEITLAQSTVQETVTVVDEAPLVATSPSIGTIVSQQELKSLPLNGRQFANVAALAPGTTLSVNADPTKPGQLTIALNGGIGRNINFLVDGGDNTDDTIGGALQNYNLDAVQEFKIQTAQYKAEFGRSSGGVLSVVTKTGTNEFRGSAYEFARRTSMDSKTHTEELAGADKAPYKRDQYGATIGGPIVQDKIHFFATYEKLKRDQSYTVNTGGVFPGFDGVSTAVPFTDKLATGKITATPSAEHLIEVRYGYQQNVDLSYGAVPIYLPSATGAVTNKYSSVLLGDTWQIGGDMLNELRYQHSKFENGITSASNAPNLYFPSGVQSGQNPNTPQTTLQTKNQYKDDFSWSKDIGGRRHDFKAGLSYIDEPTLGGSFATGTAGQFQMLTDDPNGPVRTIIVNGGNANYNTPIKEYAGYFQDDWYASDSLTFNIGVRYDLNKGFDIDQRNNPVWQYLSQQTQYNESYLRDFQGGKGGKLKNDTNNWAPRLGFNWDMNKDGKNMLRGGYGRFYDFPYTNATILFPSIAIQTNFGVIYQLTDDNGIKNPDGSFFHPGQPLPPGGGVSGGVPVPREVASPTLATPYSDQFSLGYSWQVSNELGLTFDAIDSQYHDIPFRFRFNATLDANGNPMATTRFPFSANTRLWYGKGTAYYRGVNIGFRFRQPKFELQGFYTLSKAEGDVLAGADEFRLGDGNFQSDYQRDQSINPLNPLCSACTGPLYTDARNRITFGGTYHAPWALEVSGFFRYRSALPYNRLNSSGPGGAIADLNGDGYTQDLAPGVSNVNTGRGAAHSQFDMRLSREFVIGNDFGIELIGEVFNLFNSDNPAKFDRNGKAHAFAGDSLQGEQRLAQLGLRLRWK